MSIGDSIELVKEDVRMRKVLQTKNTQTKTTTTLYYPRHYLCYYFKYTLITSMSPHINLYQHGWRWRCSLPYFLLILFPISVFNIFFFFCYFFSKKKMCG